MNYVSRFKNSYITRLTLSYSIFAAILLSVSALYFYAKANKVLIHEMTMESDYQLEKIRAFTENSLLQKFEQMYSEKVMSTVDALSPSDYSYFLTNSWEGNSYRVVQFVNNLHQSLMASGGLDDVTVYFSNENFVVNANNFYAGLGSFGDKDFVRSLPSAPHNRWFRRTSAEGKQLLTYVYSLPYLSIGDKIEGYLYIDASIEEIKKLCAGMLNSSTDQLYVLDPTGKLVFSGLPPSRHDLQLIENLQKEQREYTVDDEKTGRRVISYLRGDRSSQGWGYAIVRPMSSLYISADQLKNEVLWASFILLAFGFVISYFISRRVYLPFRRLLFNISNVYGIPKAFQNEREYKLIDHVIHILDRKLVNLDDHMRAKQLAGLIKGDITAQEDFPHIPMPGRYSVVQIKIHKGAAESLKVRFDTAGHCYPYESVVLNNDELVILYFIALDELHAEASIHGDLAKFMTLARSDFHLGMGIGPIVSTIDEIHTTYKESRQVNKYSFLYDTNYILAYDDIQKRSSGVHALPCDRLEQAIKAGESAEAERILHEWESRAREDSVRLEAAELILANLAGVLSKLVIDLNIQKKMASVSDILVEYRRPTLSETIRWFSDLCQEIILHAGASINKSNHTETIHQLKAYIDTNLQEDISLDTLAEKAHLSAPYISTLFREVMNVSFSEYLITERLKKAAELLRTGHSSVKEISAAVGYRNVPYFCTKFKEKYGATPIQFRNSIYDSEHPAVPKTGLTANE